MNEPKPPPPPPKPPPPAAANQGGGGRGRHVGVDDGELEVDDRRWVCSSRAGGHSQTSPSPPRSSRARAPPPRATRGAPPSPGGPPGARARPSAPRPPTAARAAARSTRPTGRAARRRDPIRRVLVLRLEPLGVRRVLPRRRSMRTGPAAPAAEDEHLFLLRRDVRRRDGPAAVSAGVGLCSLLGRRHSCARRLNGTLAMAPAGFLDGRGGAVLLGASGRGRNDDVAALCPAAVRLFQTSQIDAAVAVSFPASFSEVVLSVAICAGLRSTATTMTRRSATWLRSRSTISTESSGP